MRPKLKFLDLAMRHPGLTESVAAYMAEAARVCLDRHHTPPIDFEIEDPEKTVHATAEWESTDDRIRRAWANEIIATENGAYACALAAIELSAGMVAVHRAETKTGADYYIAPQGRDLEDLEDCFRFEVSGVDRGSAGSVTQRLNQKLAQTAVGSSNLPAMAGVVGFRTRLIAIRPLQKE